MQKASAKHRVLGHAFAELEARKNPRSDLSLSVGSIPLVGSLVNPLLDDEPGDGAQPSSTPNPQPAPTSTPGGGSGSGNGGGNTPTPIASPTSHEGTVASVSPVSIVPGPTSSGSAPGKPSGSSSANSPSNGGSMAGPGGGGGGGQPLPVNVGSEPSTTASTPLGASTPAALAFGSSSPSQYSLGSGSNTAGIAPLPTITTAAAISPGKQLSGGVIAGITIVCLFFLLALILLVVRRRSIARRMEFRRQWWFSRSPSGRNFSLNGSGSPRSPVGSSAEDPASRLSARSSFATNFDEGLMFRIDSPSMFSLGLAPDLPPMAEVRERNSVLISTGGAVARRESMNSMLSNDSEPFVQYLSTAQVSSTSMSVRPSSPTEPFAFPKPPAPSSSTADSFFISGTQDLVSSQSSVTTLVHISTPPRVFMTDLPPAPILTSFHPQTSKPSVTCSPFIAAANPSIDPFVDPAKPEFSDVEVIRRPFVSSLGDELAVRSSDRVRLLQIFDDGWVFVEKLAGTEGGRHERGLIPVDCFREADQALPTFLAEKRVSYGSCELIATAL
jgi:hypothetical protein